jgi:hypothetical protein
MTQQLDAAGLPAGPAAALGEQARVIAWSPDPRSTAVANLRCAALLRPQTEVLTTRWSISCIGPRLDPVSGEWDACLFADVDPAVNILRCLELARAALRPGGRVIVQFAPEGVPPRLPNWRSFWATIGARVGFAPAPQAAGSVVLERDTVEHRWRLELAGERHVPDIAKLFHAIYGAELDPRLWAWKYAEGRGNAVLAYRGPELVAHYGGMARDILLRGEPDWAMQVGDVMVHPDERGVLTRKGAFFLTTTTWAEMFGPLDFGFPTGRSMRLGERLGIYVHAGKTVELRWPAAQDPSIPWTTRLSAVSESADGTSVARDIDRQWQRMAIGLAEAVLGVRDWAWVLHRYLRHPVQRYEVVVARRRFSARGRGVLVIKRHAGEAELMDLIGEPGDMPFLIDIARRLCARWGLPAMFMWVARSHADLLRHHGAVERDIDLEIPTDGWTGSPRAMDLRDRWWLTSGDSDYR